MADKVTAKDNSDTSYDEKNTYNNEFDSEKRRPSLADSAGRRRSVAVNIVQNPLKVSLVSLAAW